MQKIYTAGLITLKNNKLLLAYSNNKQAWYLPGGKLDEGESSKEALIREIKEELNVNLDPDKLQFIYHISAQAYGQNPPKIMEQDCFIYPLTETITPSNEIGEVRYFDLESYKKEAVQVPGALTAFAKLKELNLL